ncbi:MAG: hypothetical protein ACOYWZ_05765 [Bacillota bacterium]
MIKLSPIVDETIKKLIAEQNLIRSFVDAYGSCVNIIFPENLNKNIQSIQSVYRKHHLNGKIRPFGCFNNSVGYFSSGIKYMKITYFRHNGCGDVNWLFCSCNIILSQQRHLYHFVDPKDTLISS